MTTEKLVEYRETCNKRKLEKFMEHDSFAFQTWKRDKFKDDPRAFELIKNMLRRENEYRLGAEYLKEYQRSQLDVHKTDVTQKLQTRVVYDFMSEAAGIYDNEVEGIRFLRSASGNFDEKIEEIKECANYVKYTHFCVRGDLRVGMRVDLKNFPLIDPKTGGQQLLSEFLKPGKPLVIIASSYT